MADTLESLEIKVQHNASGADAEINGVATAIGRLKTALTGVPAALKELASAVKAVNDAFKGGTAKYDKFAESMLNVATSAELLGENSNSVMTLANAMSTLSEVKVTASSFNSLSSGVEKVGAAAKSVTPEAIENLDKMVTSLAKLQGVDLQGLGSAMSAVRRVGAAKEPEAKVPLTEDMQALISSASQIDVLEAKLMSLRDAMQEAFSAGDMDKAYSIRGQILQTEAALEKARAAADKAGKATKEAAKGVKELSKEANKSKGPLDNLIGSLKRIAFYRIIRSVIKSITQALQEGLEKAYLFSSGISGEGNRFAQALDRMKSAGNAMKGQLGSAFISLLAAVEPILIALINLVTKAADAISQFLAAFTGKTYLKANATAAKFADTMKAGGAAAKEWKNQLLGFDEINRLNEPSNGGGGGGGSNPLDGYSFEETPIAEFWMNLVSKIQPIIDKLKLVFEGAWEVIKGIMTGDWQMVFDGAAKIVENFAGAVSDALGLTKEPVASFFDFVSEKVKGLGEHLDEKFGTDGVFSKIAYYVVYAMNLIKYTIESIIGKLQIVIQGFGKIVSDVLRGDWDAAWKDAAGLVSVLSIEISESIADMAKQATDELFGLDSDTSKSMSDIAKSFGDVKQPANDLAFAIVNGLASSANVSADAADAFGTNMESIRNQLAATGASSLSATANENGITFKSFIASAWTAVKRVLANPLFFANGGFPDTGSLYFAGERGPELVGTMGNRNAVANNDQIVEGIRQGVYDAVVAANGNGSNDVSVRVYLDSKEIKAGQQRLDRAWGV